MDKTTVESLRAITLRCDYILNMCKGEREMRLEAEEIKRLVRALASPDATLRERLERAEKAAEGLREQMELIANFTNGYGDVVGIVYKRAREALRQYDAAIAGGRDEKAL